MVIVFGEEDKRRDSRIEGTGWTAHLMTVNFFAKSWKMSIFSQNRAISMKGTINPYQKIFYKKHFDATFTGHPNRLKTRIQKIVRVHFIAGKKYSAFYTCNFRRWSSWQGARLKPKVTKIEWVQLPDRRFFQFYLKS